MRNTFLAGLITFGFIASEAQASADPSFERNFNRHTQMKDNRNWGPGEYGEDCIELEGNEGFRFVGDFKPLTTPNFDRGEMWALYHVPGPWTNEYYVINVKRA